MLQAAVLQNAADYMVQLLEERKQLLMRNAELTQAIGAQRQTEEAAPARRKRDMTGTHTFALFVQHLHRPSVHSG